MKMTSNYITTAKKRKNCVVSQLRAVKICKNFIFWSQTFYVPPKKNFKCLKICFRKEGAFLLDLEQFFQYFLGEKNQNPKNKKIFMPPYQSKCLVYKNLKILLHLPSFERNLFNIRIPIPAP